jgi:hypothetical protein
MTIRHSGHRSRRPTGANPGGVTQREARRAAVWGVPILGCPAALLAFAVAACAPTPQTPQARAAAETDAACRQRADEAYDRQNRGEIYSITDRNVPFSANYLPDVPNRGLSQLYAHDVMVRDCVRNTGTETGRTATGGGGGDEAQAGAPRAQP